MTHRPSVTQIWRYPAKSMLGERLDRTEVTATGLVGDRGWAVRDEVRGGIRGAKKIGELMRLSARYLTEPEPGAGQPPIEIRLPDGTVTTSQQADVNERLSSALGHAVSLWPLQPETDLDHYRRGAPDSDDVMTELREMFGRTVDEPLPDLAAFPPELVEFESPPGSYVDAYPLMLLTDTSLASLAALAPGSAVDIRRFRPNIVVESGETGEAWPELGWIGRRIRVGTAEIEVVGPCPRCVMVTRAVAELGEDRRILRTIVASADQNLGVYATVIQPGDFVVGDPLIMG